MKAGFVAAAVAALAGSAAAGTHRHAHNNHEQLFAKRNAEVCTPGCTTMWTTIYGEATLYSPPETAAPTTKAPAATTSAPVLVPTPIAQTCPTPGVYTFPATTVTLNVTTTVCAATSTKLPSGTHTIGGVTTVVATATTVVCPYATVSTKSGGVVTSVIETTTYVCPSAGTYTIAPHTTTVTVSETLVVYPVVTTYCPGTYTAPAVVTTVTETATVIYCPFTGQATTQAPAVAASPTTAAQPPASTAKAPSGNGDHWAITYTPYTNAGACKSASDVLSDLTDLKNKGFTTVRVYSTDCDTLPNVGAACSTLGMKIIVGVFVTGSGCGTDNPDLTSQVAEITAWARWDLVELVVVGNECVHNGYCTPASLQALIVWVKSACSGAGYTGTYTTAETVDVWQRSDMQASICGVIDIVGGQIHAYFNAETTPDQAGVFVKGQLDILDSDAICPGKSSLNLECGWPSQCNCNGVACCGPENQSTAIASIREVIGAKVVFFSTHDDPWKSADTSCGCEQHWGCSNLFG